MNREPPADIVGYNPIETATTCSYDHDAAQFAVDFFAECIHHVEGTFAGQPFIMPEWQENITRTLFGWKRPDGSRRYRDVYMELPRKNGKTTWAAGVALYLLACDNEQKATVYCCAGDIEQATLVFSAAASMVAREEMLTQRLIVRPSVKRILYPEREGYLRAIPANASTKHGLNPSGIIFDELHVQPDRDLWDTMQTGKASTARRQPLTIAITTAGYDRHSICWEQHDYAIKVRDGIIENESFLPVIYAASTDDDWTSEETWKKANPNYGISVSPEYLATECQRAQDSPAYENTFRRLHLNQWTEQATRWIPMAKWDACSTEYGPLQGCVCFGGLDLSTTYDITALTLVFPHDDGTYSIVPYCWIPDENAHDRERKDRVPYMTWAKQGFIETTPGDVIDYGFVRKKINELGDVFNIKKIAADRWNATHIIQELEGDGFEMVSFGQGYASMTAPTKLLETLIREKKIRHNAHPVLRWAMSNVMVEQDAAGNIKPSKRKSTERIDPIVAAVMGIGLASSPEHNQRSIYETRGVLSL